MIAITPHALSLRSVNEMSRGFHLLANLPDDNLSIDT